LYFNESIFLRKTNKYEFYIDKYNEKILLKLNKFKTDYIKPTKKEAFSKNNFITLDIETQVINNEHIPYCICYYDGIKTYSFYLSDFDNVQTMFNEVILSLLKPKYSGYIIYAHNLSNFDGIFLLGALVNFLDSPINPIKINPIIRDNNFINIKINHGPKFKYNIAFRDSYLLLPLSLKKLAIQFNVDHLKTVFPHNFLNNKINPGLNLNYIGMIPDLNYFSNKNDFLLFLQDFVEMNENISN
jgi:hypothetical protein